MKKILFCAALALFAAACSDSEDTTGGGTQTSGLKAPEVTFENITSVSFSATWPAVKGADEYRYEVTLTGDEGNTAIAATNTTETSFEFNTLVPGATYEVRVAARADGVTSKNWFYSEVTTSGTGAMTFTITPYEKYSEDGYVYPFAHTVPSDNDLYYWVGAIPSDQTEDAADWIAQDIEYYTSLGLQWDDLLEAGLICQGETDSPLFKFVDYGDFVFMAAAIGKTLSGIKVLSEPSLSHPFWTEAPDQAIRHAAEYDDFLGDWVLTTAGTMTSTPSGTVSETAGSIFPVNIKATSDRNGFELTGWGGDKNRFASHPLRLDYMAESDGYNRFSISFPQQITEENGTTWEYVSWFIFYGTVDGEEAIQYTPYDSEMAQSVPAWALGFKGYVANLNQTVIKIFGEEYTDPNTMGEGAYMKGIWPLGSTADGEYVMLNGTNEEPTACYYLVRKDVAEGLVLELPDTSNAAAAAKHATPASVRYTSAQQSYTRVMR